MTVRIIRILEYTYGTLEEANADMRRWSVPPCGTSPRWEKSLVVRSATMMAQDVGTEPPKVD